MNPAGQRYGPALLGPISPHESQKALTGSHPSQSMMSTEHAPVALCEPAKPIDAMLCYVGTPSTSLTSLCEPAKPVDAMLCYVVTPGTSLPSLSIDAHLVGTYASSGVSLPSLCEPAKPVDAMLCYVGTPGTSLPSLSIDAHLVGTYASSGVSLPSLLTPCWHSRHEPAKPVY
eukprot:1156994-Pelagomonas_calceolata.AAC.5